MTRVAAAGSGALPASEVAKRQRHDDAGRQTPPRKDGRQAGAETGLRSDVAAREQQIEAERIAAFERSARQALHSVGEDEASRGLEQSRLLAAAEWRPHAVPPAVGGAAQAGSPSGVAQSVAELSARIEEMARRELAVSGGRPISLQVPLDASLAGVQSVTVTMSPTTLDVTLNRTGNDVSDELIGAAQMLVDRLQLRFSKKLVRVFDKHAVENAAAGDAAETSMDAISSLLRRNSAGEP
jgi:hypothetical protein